MYSETCQIISHMGSLVKESCTPGSTGGVFREGHVCQPKPHVRFCEGRILQGVRLRGYRFSATLNGKMQMLFSRCSAGMHYGTV